MDTDLNILFIPFNKSFSATPLNVDFSENMNREILLNILMTAFTDGKPHFIDKNPLLDEHFSLKIRNETIKLDEEDTLDSLKNSLKKLGIKKTKKADYKNLCIGGNHLLSYYLVAEASIRYRSKLSCLIFDAHHDLWDETPPGEKYTNGTWLRRAIEDGYVDPEKTAIIGIRSVYSEESMEFYKKNNIMVLHNTTIQRMTSQSVVQQILGKLDKDLCYLSFDVDFFDPSCMQAVRFPEWNGFDSRFFFDFLSYMTNKWSSAPINFVGYDIVEYYSELDNISKTSGYLVSTIMFWLLCYEYLRKKTS